MALSANHGILRSIGKRLAYAAGADYADYCVGENGYQDCRVRGKGQESV